jgi:hypothetical protein
MIDWRNTPRGSTADIYWPKVDVADVVRLASKLYPSSSLMVVNANTVRCTVGHGPTFLPIPTGSGESFAGLITLQLPNGIRIGNQFKVVIRRISSRRFGKGNDVIKVAASAEFGASAQKLVEWRYVVGTFQMTIPVKPDADILPSEENLLAILKWRLTLLGPQQRWYPILLRYIDVVAKRVKRLGGDPNKIQGSPLGAVPQLPSRPHHVPRNEHEWTGKVIGIRYDRFGDFIGFDLLTLEGRERSFRGREDAIEQLVRKAWNERILLSVLARAQDAVWPSEIILRRPSPAD